MAFRHYEGSPRPRAAAWKCPSCHADNTGPLEDGCTSCGAGADARKGTDNRVPPAAASAMKPPPSQAPADGVPPLKMERWEVAYSGLTDTQLLEMDERDLFKAGWDAALKWGVTAPVRKPTAMTTGPSEGEDAPRKEKLILATMLPHTDSVGAVDDTTRDTILAALAFYRDNQLAYGPQPGQLSAEQVTELITQLTPEESDDHV